MLVSLLDEGIRTGRVIKTDQAVKHTIDGNTRTYAVYQINIDELYYNNHNDRIATWVSQYRAENDGHDPIELSREEYNDIIEGYIVQSNTEAIRGTQKNIAAFGQRVPGVVLNDGLVIDGNRRLTCIRRNAKESNTVGWFEAVILPDELASDPKRIKLLELSIQHGEEGKVDYDPIERLVGVYNDIIKDGLLTEAEYAQSTGMRERDVQSLIEQAGYMRDFLEFCNAPEQYHLARELLIAGPVGEIPRILKKATTRGQRQQVKEFIFANIVAQPIGDITRFVRKFGKIVGTDYADEFYGDEKTALTRLVHVMGPNPLTKESVRAIRANDAITDSFRRAMERAERRTRLGRLKGAPYTKSKSALGDLQQIHVAMIRQLSEQDRAEVRFVLQRVVECANGLIRECDACD